MLVAIASFHSTAKQIKTDDLPAISIDGYIRRKLNVPLYIATPTGEALSAYSGTDS